MIPSLSRTLRAGALLCVPFLTTCGSGPTMLESFVTINGTVYEGFDDNGEHANRVAGAIVSTSLDDETTTTEVDGSFELVTTADADEWACEEYTISVEADGFQMWDLDAKWPKSPIILVITLAPPTPDAPPVGLPCQ